MPNENVSQDRVGYLEAERFSGFSQGTLQKLIRNGLLRATKKLATSTQSERR